MNNKTKIASISAVLMIVCLSIAIYSLSFNESPAGITFGSHNVIHLLVQQYRNGILISETYHTMTITNFGKNQTRDLLGGVNTDAMLYFANSNDTTAFDATWTTLPGETTTAGLGRALGAYTLDNTGNGKWNVTYTWTATSSMSANLYGLYSTAYSGATLCYAEQQGAGAVKNMVAGDTLKLTAQGTAS